MKKSLHQLASENGQLAFEPGRLQPDNTKPYKWQHLVADRLHGWSEHNYHYEQKPVMLETDDYLAALKAAEDGLSPHLLAIADSQEHLAEVVEQMHVHGLPIAEPEEKVTL